MSMNDVVLKLRKRYRKKISRSTVHRWIKDTEKIRSRSRSEISRMDDPVIIRDLLHSNMVFKFSIHRSKVERCGYDALEKYLFEFQDRPEFQDGNRCSSLKVAVDAKVERREDPACEAASFCIDRTVENRKRHEIVERFMLFNDDVTVATEVPVYFWDKKIGSVTGHIDILQVKDGKVRILDYKPGARKEHPEGQLLMYARALSYRTKVPLKDMECAWFDGNDYFCFTPADAIWKWR
ncbi:MAG: PD-(D/E)XK nuclease family protein [Candidatus Thermoplasmatota archaeon]|nr:PD-(D/E)XK nuclease family protein [Candidatus Thermoplasmatota archaeon]